MRREYPAQLVRVVDADTIRLDIDLGLRIWAHDQVLRLYGINAPEINTDAGKAAAKATAGWFANLPRTIYIATFKNPTTDEDRVEKYGRWLAEVYAFEDMTAPSLNDYLVTNGHAIPYMVGM